ncbi:hypothetical protein [Aquisphaera insulae]|uniref:hypothetical protein n=1 Tax=Aquisphaera insulae TaxID=2712864 RepID=UPI0013ECD317|nr:hypothetical protein [Aquisphaera insulae]
MLRRDLLRSSLAAPLSRWLGRFVPLVYPRQRVEDRDAAEEYSRAVDWVRALGDDDRRRLRESRTAPLDDPRIVDLIRRADSVLGRLRAAAGIDRCSWRDRAITSSEQLNRGQVDVIHTQVIRVACLSARRHMAAGRTADALDDLFAGWTLARRLGEAGVQFARLLECGGEFYVIETLGEILPALGRLGLDDLVKRLDAFPAAAPASASIGPEARFMLAPLRARLATGKPVFDVADWADAGWDEKESGPLLRLAGGDRAKVLVHLEATTPAIEELARRSDLPHPSWHASLDEFAAKEREVHPIAASFAGIARNIRRLVDRMTVNRALLRAGITLVRDGEPAFRAVADPFGHGPFGLDREGNGWRIRSALHDEAPAEASLRIGSRG